MMDCARDPSRTVAMLQVFSALDLYIVFGSPDREAAMRSARPRAGAEAPVGSTGEVRASEWPWWLNKIPVGALD
jgi:hypothetical protein